MRMPVLIALLAIPAPIAAQQLQPGAWDVTSTVVSMTIPGLPGFIARMVRGKSRAEHKRLGQGATLEALLAPDPKAKCRIDGQHIADGHYEQHLSCPQTHGDPLRITRTGTFDASGFTGRATVVGSVPKGPSQIVLDQRAARTGN